MLNRFLAATTAALLVSGCSATIGGAGRQGPPGPPGPRGAQLALPLFATGDVTVDPNTDVVVARTALTVTLPSAQMAGRLITVRAAGGAVKVQAGAGERVERGVSFMLDDGEMATFLSDGAIGWFVISSSDL